LAAAIQPVYTAPSAEAASAALDAFEASAWGQKFPTVVAAWRNAWERVIPFFAFPPAVRKVIYTTNAIESVNAQLRKSIKARDHFPSDEAATKFIWLALRNIMKKWSRRAHDWKTDMNQFAILFVERFVQTRVIIQTALNTKFWTDPSACPVPPAGDCSLHIMEAALNDIHCIVHHFIYKSVLLIYPSRPISTFIMS